MADPPPPPQGAELWVGSSSAYRTAKEQEEMLRWRQAAGARHAAEASHAAGSAEAASADATYWSPAYIDHRHVHLQASRSKQAVNRSRTRVLLYCVTAVHVGLFLALLALNDWALLDLADNPLLGPGTEALLRIGATSAVKMSAGHEYWRLLVSPFLGAGVLHVWANVATLFTFGVFLSNELPVWQIGLLYICSGLSAVTVSANIGARYITAAGSGPAFGFIGGSCAVLLLHMRKLRNHVLTWLLVALNLAINAFIGATPFVDNSGNTAGFVSGLMMTAGMLFVAWDPASHQGEVTLRLAAIVLLSLPVLLPVLGIIGLNAGLPLSGCCDQWVCVSSPWWNCAAAQAWPGACSFSVFVNGTTVIGCPQGQTFQIPSLLINHGNTTVAALDSFCESYCDEV